MNDIACYASFASHAIDIPRKVSRPKVKNAFLPPLSYTDVSEGHFLFETLGKAVFRSSAWEPGIRTDVIEFDEVKYGKYFEKLKIGTLASPDASKMINILVKTF